MGKMLYAGMEMHKKFCKIMVCTKEGEIVKKGRIRTNEKEIRDFFYGLKNVERVIETIKDGTKCLITESSEFSQ